MKQRTVKRDLVQCQKRPSTVSPTMHIHIHIHIKVMKRGKLPEFSFDYKKYYKNNIIKNKNKLYIII